MKHTCASEAGFDVFPFIILVYIAVHFLTTILQDSSFHRSGPKTVPGNEQNKRQKQK